MYACTTYLHVWINILESDKGYRLTTVQLSPSSMQKKFRKKHPKQTDGEDYRVKKSRARAET